MAGEKNQSVDVAAVIAAALAGMSAGGAGVGQDLVYIGGTGGATKTITLKRSGKQIKVPTPNVKTVSQLVTEYLTSPNMQTSWRKTMQKYGLETGNPIAERKVFEAAIAGASDWYTTSNGKQKVTPEQYLGWYAGGQKGTKKEPALPTRQIYAATPQQIADDINEIALKRLGRTVTDSDKQMDWYKNLVSGINELYQKGIVTETKQVKNPKTGKMENVVIQTPGFSTEQVSQKITKAVEGADPEALARNERINFSKFLFSQGGQQG
jgi:hypothetical protein